MAAKVTILTCVYNGLPYLKEAIDSTLSQTYSDFEYLIIDDASTDKDVVEFIESYDDHRIHFEKNDVNLGVSRTFNKALSMIKTEYVVRIDQDDVNLPRRVEEQINYLENNPEISVVCSWEHTIDSEGRIIGDCKKNIKDYGEFLGPLLLGLCPIWHPSIAFRKNDVIKAGGFKVEYTRAEDFDVTARLALHRYSAAIVPKFHLMQRQHDYSQSKEFIKEQIDMTKEIQKNVLSNFLDTIEAEKLSSFLRLENKTENSEFGKDYIVHMRYLLINMFENVATMQEMNSSEFSSMKKIIYKRLGPGVYLIPAFKLLPAFIFMPIFYTLSPLFSNALHRCLSNIYNSFHELRYRRK